MQGVLNPPTRRLPSQDLIHTTELYEHLLTQSRSDSHAYPDRNRRHSPEVRPMATLPTQKRHAAPDVRAVGKFPAEAPSLEFQQLSLRPSSGARIRFGPPAVALRHQGAGSRFQRPGGGHFKARGARRGLRNGCVAHLSATWNDTRSSARRTSTPALSAATAHHPRRDMRRSKTGVHTNRPASVFRGKLTVCSAILAGQAMLRRLLAAKFSRAD